jgi:hypothetical protein
MLCSGSPASQLSAWPSRKPGQNRPAARRAVATASRGRSSARSTILQGPEREQPALQARVVFCRSIKGREAHRDAHHNWKVGERFSLAPSRLPVHMVGWIAESKNGSCNHKRPDSSSGKTTCRARICRSESLARPPILSSAQNPEDVVLSRAFADQEFGFYAEDSVTLHFL